VTGAFVADDGILELAGSTLEDEVVLGRLPMNFLQRHLVRADRALRRFRIGLLKFENAKTPLLGRRPCLSQMTGMVERIARVARQRHKGNLVPWRGLQNREIFMGTRTPVEGTTTTQLDATRNNRVRSCCCYQHRF
jgi:hypothetical protein